MKQRLVIAGVVAFVVLVGWVAWTQVAGDSAGRPAGPGNGPVPVLDRINAEVDCAELQGEFDRAGHSHHTEWMVAADRRMRAVGCYGR